MKGLTRIFSYVPQCSSNHDGKTKMCSTSEDIYLPSFVSFKANIFSRTELLKHVREQPISQGGCPHCIYRASSAGRSAEPVCDPHHNPAGAGAAFPRWGTRTQKAYGLPVYGSTVWRGLVQAQGESLDTFRHSLRPYQVTVLLGPVIAVMTHVFTERKIQAAGF